MKVYQLAFVLVGFCVLVAGCGGCLSVADTDYSDGFRDVALQKFTRKGLPWMVKSWEGEGAEPGFRRAGKYATTNTWEFSVEDSQADVIAELRQSEPGTFYRMHYRQKLINLGWYHDSSYRVYRIEKVKP